LSFHVFQETGFSHSLNRRGIGNSKDKKKKKENGIISSTVTVQKLIAATEAVKAVVHLCLTMGKGNSYAD
jgi:hypothetical protein